MNAKHLIAAVAVLAATGSAFAQGNSEFVEFTDFVSTKSRAAVVAELQQARADGSLDVAEYAYPVVRLTGARKTRAEVVAELEQAQTDGSLAFSEYSYPVIQTSASTKTREQVRDELARHQRDNPYGDTYNRHIGG